MKSVYFLLTAVALVCPLFSSSAKAQPPLDPLPETKTTAPNAARVYIAGEVLRPGVHPMPVKGTLSELIKQAGGFTREADGEEVVIHRGKALLTPEQGAEFSLEEGDFVLVSRPTIRISVMGYVKRPGTYQIADGRKPSVATALALAGGSSEGDESAITLLSKSQKYDTFNKRTEKAKFDQILQNGDAIFVPPVKKDKENDPTKTDRLPAVRMQWDTPKTP